MKDFIKQILQKNFKNDLETIYDGSPLIQYLDSKMGAINGNVKTRKSLANIYAIYRHDVRVYEKRKVIVLLGDPGNGRIRVRLSFAGGQFGFSNTEVCEYMKKIGSRFDKTFDFDAFML